MCLEKILSNYKGPAFNKESLPDEYIHIDFSLYPGGVIKWVNEGESKEKLKSEKAKKALQALKEALLKSSPLAVNKRYIQDKRLTGFLDYNGFFKNELILFMEDFAGVWTAGVFDEGTENPSECMRYILSEIGKAKITSGNNVHAAVWFYVLPDGTIEGIRDVECKKSRKQFRDSKVIQRKLRSALNKLDQDSLKRFFKDSDVPVGAVLTYRSYHKPGLSIIDYSYKRCPDFVAFHKRPK